ncbi:alpha/beta fold hydrolase [Budvicia aquatica]|uniref:alpha/beta fold hydrolase n=1 Tax=Budvicia aquatica TaxID=82979 RepID=UPI00207EFE76|nr:alpha/beta hydrolase [Budvicia aquatica]GKX51538.1 alpha/beta hydrolase [Budvicia aquatica]
MIYVPRSILLIPGYMLDEKLWDEFEIYLPKEWSVLHGPLEGGKTIREIARHLAAISPHKMTVIGFSLGGYIARQLAADFPDQVDSLVIIASSLREDTIHQIEAKRQLIQSLSASNFKGLSSTSIARSLHPCNASKSELIAHIKQMGNRLGYEALVTQSALRREGVPAAMIQCPTLIIAGSDDSLRPFEEVKELAEAIPGALLKSISDSGHMLPLEQPQKLATVIIDWLMKK